MAVEGQRLRALTIEFETLSGYQDLVKTLLTRLESNDKHLAHGALPREALGQGFAEAGRLFTAYSNVHTQLQALSKGLADQIEALGIAILSAGKGYEGVDDDLKRKMIAIAERARKAFVPENDPLYQQSQQPQPGTGSSGGRL
jgi:hypothetical protein